MYKVRSRPATAPITKVLKKAKQMNENFKKRVKRAVSMYRDRRYLYNNLTASYDQSGNYFTNSLSMTTVGDQTYGERQGDTITPSRFHFSWSWSTGDSYNQCRFIIFQWRPDDNVYPPTGAINNILNSTSIGTSGAALSQLVFDQKNFHILYDSLRTTTDSGANQCINGRVTIFGKKMLRIKYTSGATLGHNNIYGLAITDSAVAPHPQLIFNCTLEYDA